MDSWMILDLQNIAYINTQIACAYIELEALKADGEYHSPDTYKELIDKYQLGHNAVVTNLRPGR